MTTSNMSSNGKKIVPIKPVAITATSQSSRFHVDTVSTLSIEVIGLFCCTYRSDLPVYAARLEAGERCRRPGRPAHGRAPQTQGRKYRSHIFIHAHKSRQEYTTDLSDVTAPAVCGSHRPDLTLSRVYRVHSSDFHRQQNHTRDTRKSAHFARQSD